MTIRFTDGMEFDTSGELRKVKRSDGWYVVGDGMLVPVGGPEEADAFIDNFTKASEEGRAR